MARSRYKAGLVQKTCHGTVILLTTTGAVSRHNAESKPEICHGLPECMLRADARVRVQ